MTDHNWRSKRQKKGDKKMKDPKNERSKNEMDELKEKEKHKQYRGTDSRYCYKIEKKSSIPNISSLLSRCSIVVLL